MGFPQFRTKFDKTDKAFAFSQRFKCTSHIKCTSHTDSPRA